MIVLVIEIIAPWCSQTSEKAALYNKQQKHNNNTKGVYVVLQ